tara:strand:+ start:4419 stop:4526 length:108 start_codon:yes stop_codon:yes gene_type:complete
MLAGLVSTLEVTLFVIGFASTYQVDIIVALGIKME